MKSTVIKEEQLTQLVLELYHAYSRVITPLYPRIFIRVLPKESLSAGGIVLPDHQQNKTQWEGMVLATYKPFWRPDDDGHSHITPTVKAGDHILFPYHVGMPDPVFDEKKYRLVDENQISAVLHYAQESPENWVQSKVNDYARGVLPTLSEFHRDLFENFDLVRKHVQPKTTSGV